MPKVLVAEDDLLVADLVELVLIDGGYEVCGIARTVEGGVALGERHKPNLALLDLRLADRGRGTEIAARLDRKGGLGILYATGIPDRTDLTSDDGDACLDKPYRPAELVRALEIAEEMVSTGKATRPLPTSFRVLQPPSSSSARRRAANFRGSR